VWEGAGVAWRLGLCVVFEAIWAVWVRVMKLEREVIPTHMTQKPLLWVEVGAHAVHKKSEYSGVWAGAGVARRLCVCCLCSLFGLSGVVSFLCVVGDSDDGGERGPGFVSVGLLSFGFRQRKPGRLF
jgi:hypothetical protein